MANPVPVTFGEWRPDMAPHMSPALAEAENVLPVAGAYAPFPAHVPIAANTLPSPAKGFFSTLLPDGTPIIYAATSAQIYRLGTATITSVYDGTPIVSKRWWFARVGDKLCVGCEGLPPVGGQLGAALTPLGGSPPSAAVGAVVNRDYLVLGNLDGEPVDGKVENRIRWSGIQNPDTWGTNIGTGADFEDMHEEGGPVVAITGRTFGLVFQRKAITRMQPSGDASTVFDFTTIEIGRGAVSSGAVCDIGAGVFYRADDGFFVHDGTQSVPIGTGRVDDWFANNADPTKLDLMRAGYDPVHRCVLWAFTENGEAANSALLAYSIADNKFTLVRSAMQEIGASATMPVSIEAMPPPDGTTVSWDDGLYAGKKPIFSGIDSSNSYGTFTGSALASKITTGDYQAAPGQRSFITGVRPIIDASGVQIAVGEREQASRDAVVWNAATGLGVSGVCPQRFDARYARYRQTTVAGEAWTRSAGIEIDMQPSGAR